MIKFFRKPLALVLCFLLVSSAIIPVFGDTPSNDYESHWAKDAIWSAFSTGIVKGYPDGSFKPDKAITRAEFFALVNNVFSFTSGTETTYNDVSSDAWYAPVIAKAEAAGYISGYPDGSIRPEGSISRQEVAVIISNLKSLTAASNDLPFTDAASIASWSKQAIIAVAGAKIMNGYADGSFKPNAPSTRAEALVALTKGFKYAPVEVTVVVSAINTQQTMILTAGGAAGTITATITPANATNKNVNWTSSDTNVATVNGGVVIPISVGTATITATSAADGTKTATTAVTVNIAGPEVVIPPVANSVNLGMADDFVILAKTGISSVPNSIITGNIGVSPIDATALTGFSLTADATNQFSVSSQITGKAYASNYTSPTPGNLTTAVSDMETAYTDAAGRAVNYTELYSGDISGRTLAAGVYKWGTGVLINSDVTLNGGANDVWIFQIGEGITQANGIKIILAGGAQAKNIFWQAAETVSIGTGAHFEGIILSQTNITLGTNSSINGRLLAQTAVTLDATTVVAP
ncbi:MAG TPA: ice-binding family protein [Ruminiclostridium sp.]